jgi:hypothetical protein
MRLPWNVRRCQHFSRWLLHEHDVVLKIQDIDIYNLVHDCRFTVTFNTVPATQPSGQYPIPSLCTNAAHALYGKSVIVQYMSGMLGLYETCPCYASKYKVGEDLYKVFKCKLPHLKILELSSFNLNGIEEVCITSFKAKNQSVKFFEERYHVGDYDGRSDWINWEIPSPTREKPIKCNTVVQFGNIDEQELEIETCNERPRVLSRLPICGSSPPFHTGVRTPENKLRDILSDIWHFVEQC